MHRVAARVEPAIDRHSVSLGNVHHGCVRRGLAGLQGRVRIAVDGRLFGREDLPVTSRVAPGTFFRFDERFRLAPLTPRFLIVLRRVESLEQVLHIHLSFLATAVKSCQRHIDGADHGLGLPRTVPQTLPLIEQGGLPVEARVVERPPDFFQRQTELSADEDLLQPKQVRVDVNAVTGRCPGSGYEEPYGIVVMQRADRHARESSHVFDQIGARSSHNNSVQPDAT